MTIESLAQSIHVPRTLQRLELGYGLVDRPIDLVLEYGEQLLPDRELGLAQLLFLRLVDELLQGLPCRQVLLLLEVLVRGPGVGVEVLGDLLQRAAGAQELDHGSPHGLSDVHVGLRVSTVVAVG